MESALEGKIFLKDALEKDDSLEIGSLLIEPLPPIDLSHVAAQTAKQIITES